MVSDDRRVATLTDITNLRTELREDIRNLRNDLYSEIDDLRRQSSTARQTSINIALTILASSASVLALLHQIIR